MSDTEDTFDPQLLQARWVLGGVGAEELTNQATLALMRGFDGPALRQLAGLMQPALRDLGALPGRAFAEMGLKHLGKDRAVDVLVEHRTASLSAAMTVFVDAFPDFSKRWRRHVADEGGNPSGPYTDMSAIVHFVVEDLYENGDFEQTRQVFDYLEKLFVEGNQETRDLIGVGFFEKLRNFASWRPYGNTVFKKFLGPVSRQVWSEIEKQWTGRSSLMEIIRAERDRG